MTRRKSIHIGEFKHANPIPNACRIGNLLMSGVILGRDPATGKMPEKIEDQCANMFGHMKAIVEAGGGATSDIIKMTVWLQDRTQRAPVMWCHHVLMPRFPLVENRQPSTIRFFVSPSPHRASQ
jgi:enamine deaminase RidA (YjgF/YER057c/UK114 family)